jgi:ATP-dependent Clp protease ATP-binding subunit ClpX
MNNKPDTVPALPSPAQIIAHLDKYVRGQHLAKQDIAVSVYNHYISQVYRDLYGTDLGRYHIMMLGPTGSGKTFLVKTLAEFLGVPVSFASATSLVEAGYRGRSVDDIVKSLLDRTNGNPRLAERGILFIDEIDKIRRQDVGGLRDVSGEGVQNALLTMLDGRIADNVDSVKHEPVDTSRILFVCTGAFVGLQEIVERRIGQNQHASIGFTRREREELTKVPEQPIYQALCKAVTTDLVDFGMIPEFIGRFATITALHELGREDLRAILSDQTQGSALDKQKKLAEVHGIELEITDDALDAIADEAIRLGTGARGLHRLLGRAVDSVDHRWVELADQGITRVIVNRQSALGLNEPLLEKSKRVHVRIDLEMRQEAMASLPGVPTTTPNRSPANNQQALPPGITNTRGWDAEQLQELLENVKKDLDWEHTTGSARKWWNAFEEENKTRVPLVIRLAEELKVRKATITEFFLAYVYSNTDNIQANLHYLDYVRIKREEEQKRKGPEGGSL